MSETLTPIVLRTPANEPVFARRCCHRLLTECNMAPYSAQLLLNGVLDLKRPANMVIAMSVMNSWGSAIGKQVAMTTLDEVRVTEFIPVSNVPTWVARAVVESPYAGDTEDNLKYLKGLLLWCVKFGYAPWASHAVYTQKGVLIDEIAEQRTAGIEAGLLVASFAQYTILGTEKGISKGMQYGMANAQKAKRQIIYK